MLMLTLMPVETTSNLLTPSALQSYARATNRKHILPEATVIDTAPDVCIVGRVRQ
jgi:hypothetical protein